ncbi:MAG: hypothetical protein WCL27_17980 [Betaproteobacteria bacterium]
MKKFDIFPIIFGVLLSVVALYFMLRFAPSQSAPASTIPAVQIGITIWDQIEMTIADVKA